MEESRGVRRSNFPPFSVLPPELGAINKSKKRGGAERRDRLPQRGGGGGGGGDEGAAKRHQLPHCRR